MLVECSAWTGIVVYVIPLNLCPVLTPRLARDVQSVGGAHVISFKIIQQYNKHGKLLVD